MIVINEDAARRSKENMSFSDYRPGSATAKYNEYCKDADERAAEYPDNPKAHEAAERYKYEMGTWINKSNANGARHVSVMISGASNYNMRAHEKYMSREKTLYEDYEAINRRFNSAMHAALKPVIHDADSDALGKLREKLAKEEEYHTGVISYNKKAKTDGESIAPAYMLQNSNGRIKQLRDRIERLEKIKGKEPRKLDFDGGYIEENIEAGRTQIFFDSKPDSAMRDELKTSGWKWSPNAGAWQRRLTPNAWNNAMEICKQEVPHATN